jgi:hypothetical protein
VVVIMVVILEVKSTRKKIAMWVGPLPCNQIYMRAGKQTGHIEGGPANLFLREKLTEMLYIPRVGERYSVICGKANASGAAYFCHLKGSFPAGGELVEPFSVQNSP